MDIGERQGEVRGHDRQYAREQMVAYGKRNATGVCNLDSAIACSTAWRCGFKCKPECCQNFVNSKRGVEVFWGVPTKCEMCARKGSKGCVFVCVRESVGVKKVG
jgi:hypothetical protein